MNNTDAWILFEALAASDLSRDERGSLEARLAADPALSARLAAFRSLSEWPALEEFQSEGSARSRARQRFSLEFEGGVMALDLGRLFPLFFGGALAASLILGLVNVWQYCEFVDGTVDALFGMPAESIETAIAGQL